MTKIYALVDCNSFFASCEKVFRPEWQDRPLVVLSNNDGCIIARSPEAKPLVAMGTPYFQVKNQLERLGVIVRSSNFSLYGDLSRRVMSTLEQWSSEIEIYSIDEAFLNLTGRFPPYTEALETELASLGKEIVQTIPRWTGIPVSLGIGPTRTLAKAANKIAKSIPEHYCSFMSEKARSKYLSTIPIEEIWGVGRHLTPKLRRLGLRNSADLLRVDPLWARKNFSTTQERLLRELRGEERFDAETVPSTPHSIRASRSFGTPVSTLESLLEAVSTFAVNAAKRLRSHNGSASAITVQIDTNRFRTNVPQVHNALTSGFEIPTSDTITILSYAQSLTKRIFQPEIEYHRAIVLLSGILETKITEGQPTLFDTEEERLQSQKRNRLMKAVDSLNHSLGAGKIFYAAEGISPQWRPEASFLSPCYTTRWSDIPIVKAK